MAQALWTKHGVEGGPPQRALFGRGKSRHAEPRAWTSAGTVGRHVDLLLLGRDALPVLGTEQVRVAREILLDTKRGITPNNWTATAHSRSEAVAVAGSTYLSQTADVGKRVSHNARGGEVCS